MIKRFLPAILAHVAAALSEILLMASAAWLIASAALHPPLSALSVGITLVRTAGISRAALRYADRFVSHKIIFKLLDDLRAEFYLKAAQIFPLKSGRSHEGELLHALTVAADLRKDFLPRVILPLTTAVLVTLLLTYFLRTPILPALLIVNVWLAAQIKVVQPDDSDYRAKILDFSDGRDELKIYGTAPAVKALDSAAQTFGADDLRIATHQINLDTACKLLNAAGFFFILLKLGAVVDTIGLTVCALILLAVLELFAQIPIALRTWKKIRAVKLTETKSETAQIEPTNHAVEIKNLSFGYGDAPVLSDFDLTLERDERLAIIGESGAGKTTLLYLLMRLFPPDKGSVALGGACAAATFTNYIFSASIRDNFRMFCGDISDDKILAALKICGLEDFDLDVSLGEDGAKLSGGERNRLQIALALAKDADVLILDEPTAGLDRDLAEKLVANLAAAAQIKTLIVITHDADYFPTFRLIALNFSQAPATRAIFCTNKIGDGF